jgi:hypothetical protein
MTPRLRYYFRDVKFIYLFIYITKVLTNLMLQDLVQQLTEFTAQLCRYAFMEFQQTSMNDMFLPASNSPSDSFSRSTATKSVLALHQAFCFPMRITRPYNRKETNQPGNQLTNYVKLT